MVKKNILRISAILIGCVCIALVLTGALPGEMEGCEGGEGAKEVDYYEYCNDRCAVQAHKEVVECDIFEGTVTEEQDFQACRLSLNCDNDPYNTSICQPHCAEGIPPQLCAEGEFWQPYISVSEASRCLNALEGLSCDHWGEIPPECNDRTICDPK